MSTAAPDSAPVHAPNSNTAGPVPKAVLDAVEQGWRERAKAQLPNLRTTSATYRKAQVEFFAGAIQALCALGYVMPPKWAVAIMSGRDCVEL